MENGREKVDDEVFFYNLMAFDSSHGTNVRQSISFQFKCSFASSPHCQKKENISIIEVTIFKMEMHFWGPFLACMVIFPMAI